jgi:hypothetical protein
MTRLTPGRDAVPRLQDACFADDLAGEIDAEVTSTFRKMERRWKSTV